MKKIIFSFAVIILYSLTALAQEGWFWQNPLPQGNDLNDVWVLNQDIIFAVGDKGTLLKSTNAGEAWEVTHKLNNISEDIVDIQFITEQKGWLLANKYSADDYGNLLESYSELLMTIDGGTSWNIIDSFDSLRLNDLCFINENVGWAVGYRQQSPDTVDGMVFKTVDGGSSWILLFERSTTDQYQNPDDGSFPYSTIQFIDESTGWIAGKFNASTPGDLLKTNDGGENWNIINNTLACIKNFQFLNTSEGWLIQTFKGWGYGYSIEKTIDGGATWQSIFSGGSINPVPTPSLYFTNNSLGWVSEGGLVHKTSDGGITWNTDTICCPKYSSTHFFDETYGCIAGKFGQILTTQNGGESWIPRTELLIDDQITSVSFNSENVGWVVANECYGTPLGGGECNGRLFKTSDGGFSWIEQLIIGNSFVDVQAVSDQVVYAASLSAFQGFIHKTTNGGSTWSQLANIGAGYINTLFFLNENNGFVGSSEYGSPYDPGIYKTTDGGNSWNNVLQQAPHSIESIFFANNLVGWAVGWENPIYKTVDGGDNWQVVANNNLRLKSILFIDSNNGWAIGTRQVGTTEEGVIIKSLDGGYNWDTVYTSQDYVFNSVFFNSALKGYVVGYSGIILSTTDGGAHWYPQFDNSNKFLADIFFINENNGWVVGDDGIILKTTTGGVSFFEEEEIDEVPTEFMLLQNYPNPFNPVTSIQYAVSSRQFVKLTVYDVLGNEIETLVNEERPAGSYEVEFDAEKLSSGVYFYQLKAGDFIQTKKMILLK